MIKALSHPADRRPVAEAMFLSMPSSSLSGSVTQRPARERYVHALPDWALNEDEFAHGRDDRFIKRSFNKSP
jgi:hypothetical protein